MFRAPKLLVALWLLVALPASAQSWVYHFDPDTAPRDSGRFKAVVGALLSTIDPALKFQPFRRRVDFEKRVASAPPAFVFVAPSWLERNRQRYGLREVLVPTKDGRTGFHKHLVTKSVSLSIDGLKGRAVATTSVAGVPAGARTVIVSKDTDALLALAFGQVDAALVRPESIARLKTANPNAVANLVTLSKTARIAHPVLCQVGDRPLAARLSAGLTAASRTDLGRKALRILGFDGFQPPEARR